MYKYKHRTREERLKEIIIGQSIVSFFIIAISSWLVFWGLGYKINWQNLSIKHTGIIYLLYSPRDADVFVDGKLQNASSPYNISLSPGYYQAEIKKNGYVTWFNNIKVSADQVSSNKNIVLFKIAPKVSVLSDQSAIATIDAPIDTLVKNPTGELKTTDYEIYVGENLVTRFSEKISNVIWYPGSEYIAYQQDDEIRIIEKNGTNDIALVKLSSSTPTKFIFSWDGSLLLYKDGSEYKRAEII